MQHRLRKMFNFGGAELRCEVSGANEALAPNGRGSRGPLKGPWWGPGAMPRLGVEGGEALKSNWVLCNFMLI